MAAEGTSDGGGAPRGGNGEPCGAVTESPDAGGSARVSASSGHSGRGNRQGRWSAAGWRRWSRVGRLLNRWMQEDPLGMFRVTIIG
jgi:hypothetical protein